ncbi:MAG: nucleotidyltransferase family protein [Ruminococcaceae bacterium]|nr:nucleotidyltransferase family protein [Oscillospiraceae bacterium]
MKAVGIICEYNPFHAGHLHLLDTVRASGAETVICLMSGYFTQRGEAAILPPISRAAMAMAAGADLVLELPFPYAAASARYFATAGVDALQRLGADTLAFGSERADLPAILQAAKRTTEADFAEKVANGAKNRGDAAVFFDALGDDLLSNDILAVEYARAVQLRQNKMTLFPVLRVGAGYRDGNAEQPYPSATALREKLENGMDICDDLPACVRTEWRRAVALWGIAKTERLGVAMLARLRVMRAEATDETADCGGGLLERLIGAAREATDYESLCRAAATKKYTNGRIRRALLYTMADVRYADLAAEPAYLRLLAANERGRAFLSKSRKTRTVPVVTKQADVAALGALAARQQELSAAAESLYSLCTERPVLPRELAILPPEMC